MKHQCRKSIFYIIVNVRNLLLMRLYINIHISL